MINVKPLADRVLVEPLSAETKTTSGIIIPEMAREKPNKGSVVAVGDGFPKYPLTVKVGDMVLYGKNGSTVTVGDKDYLIMRESDILAII